jgi:hypothetical protein
MLLDALHDRFIERRKEVKHGIRRPYKRGTIFPNRRA